MKWIATTDMDYGYWAWCYAYWLLAFKGVLNMTIPDLYCVVDDRNWGRRDP